MSKRIDVDPAVTMDTVEVSEIYVDESRNMRRFPVPEKYIAELAASIGSLGQLQPVVVRPYNGESTGTEGPYKYTLVAGYCRYKAIESLGSSILVRVVEPEDMGAVLANIAENIKRKDTSVVDLSYAIGKLKDGESVKDNDTGTVTVTIPALTLKEIATSLEISHGYCSEVEKIRSLRVPIQKKIHNGDINWKLARILVTLDEAKQDELITQAESGEVSQTALAEHFNDKRRASSKKKPRKGKGGKGADAGEGEGEGEGEGGNGGSAKKPVSAKKALLVLEELAAKPGKDEEGNVIEENEAQAAAREVFALFKKFMNGKLGQQALQKNVVKAFAGE